MSESNLIGRLRRYADTQRRGLYREEPDAMDEAADKLVQLTRSLTEAREALREIVAWWDVEKKRTHADYYTGTWDIHPDEPEWVARARNLLDANAREGEL